MYAFMLVSYINTFVRVYCTYVAIAKAKAKGIDLTKTIQVHIE